MKKALTRSALAVLVTLVAVFCAGCDTDPVHQGIDQETLAKPIDQNDLDGLRR